MRANRRTQVGLTVDAPRVHPCHAGHRRPHRTAPGNARQVVPCLRPPARKPTRRHRAHPSLVGKRPHTYIRTRYPPSEPAQRRPGVRCGPAERRPPAPSAHPAPCEATWARSQEELRKTGGRRSRLFPAPRPGGPPFRAVPRHSSRSAAPIPRKASRLPASAYADTHGLIRGYGRRENQAPRSLPGR
jgi:hypothetical protein